MHNGSSGSAGCWLGLARGRVSGVLAMVRPPIGWMKSDSSQFLLHYFLLQNIIEGLRLNHSNYPQVIWFGRYVLTLRWKGIIRNHPDVPTMRHFSITSMGFCLELLHLSAAAWAHGWWPDTIERWGHTMQTFHLATKQQYRHALSGIDYRSVVEFGMTGVIWMALINNPPE